MQEDVRNEMTTRVSCKLTLHWWKQQKASAVRSVATCVNKAFCLLGDLGSAEEEVSGHLCALFLLRFLPPVGNDPAVIHTRVQQSVC